jgi:hypothetical protein
MGKSESWSPSGVFSPWVKSVDRRSVALGRPVSIVSALTAGLEGVIPGSEGVTSSELADETHGSGALSGSTRRSRLGLTTAVGSSDRNCDGAVCPVDDNNGFLVLPTGRDGRQMDGLFGGLIGGRYRYKRLIGMGTFAQILEAEDMLSRSEPRKRVAIKVTRAGMQVVGMQESQILSYLARCPGFHGSNVVEAYAAFELGEHW